MDIIRGDRTIMIPYLAQPVERATGFLGSAPADGMVSVKSSILLINHIASHTYAIILRLNELLLDLLLRLFLGCLSLCL